MFESLQEKLEKAFKSLRGQGKISEKNIQEAIRMVKLSLLEADVNFKVVKDFLARVRERAVGAEVHKSLTPGQAVVKIVHDELLTTLGEGGKLAPIASADADNGMWAVFDLVVDAPRNVLWVASTAVPHFKSYRPEADLGRAGVFKFDLKTGKYRGRQILAPKSDV